MEFYNLPYDILHIILSNLSSEQLFNICHTSRYGYEICRDEFLWKKEIYSKYGVKQKIDKTQTWYTHYIYFTTLFTQQQYKILKILKTLDQQSFNCLQNLHNYLEYIDDVGSLHTFDAILVNINTGYTTQVIIGVDILYNDKHAIKELSLNTDNTLVTTHSTIYMDDTVYHDIYLTGSHIEKHKNMYGYNENSYYILLNKTQLKMISYMYVSM